MREKNFFLEVTFRDLQEKKFLVGLVLNRNIYTISTSSSPLEENEELIFNISLIF